MNFNKELHEYSDNGVQYQSTSEWVDQFHKPFPADLIANKIAKRDGVTKEFVLGEWSLKAEMMRDYGNAGHRAVEYFIKYGKYPDQKNLAYIVEKFEETYNEANFHSEIIAYDKERKIAGTIDILEALGNKEVNILDLKFNGDIHKKPKGKLLTPFNDLSDSKINIYRLQLSMYKHLCESMGLKVKELRLLWWTGTEFEVIPLEEIDLTEALKIN